MRRAVPSTQLMNDIWSSAGLFAAAIRCWRQRPLWLSHITFSPLLLTRQQHHGRHAPAAACAQAPAAGSLSLSISESHSQGPAFPGVAALLQGLCTQASAQCGCPMHGAALEKTAIARYTAATHLGRNCTPADFVLAPYTTLLNAGRNAVIPKPFATVGRYFVTRAGVACTDPEGLRAGGSLRVLQEALHSPGLARQHPQMHALVAELWAGLLGSPHTAQLLLHLAAQSPPLGPVLSEVQDPQRLQVQPCLGSDGQSQITSLQQISAEDVR